MRIAMGLEYNGAYYHGWQSQQGLVTVQNALETALTKLANQPIKVHCAGRTDTGVHASGQVIHFDTDAQRTDAAWVLGTNSYLEPHIRVLWVKTMAEDFHARFGALRRRYRYIVYNSPVASSLLNDKVTWVPAPLCETDMAAAAQHLLGEHDFNAYRASQCQARSSIRTMFNFDVYRRGLLVCMDIEANGFLHHMVRNIVGVLIKIGKKKRLPFWAKEVLLSRDRRAADVTAPPHGLYLVEVTYPEKYGLESTASGLLPISLICC